MPPSNDLLRAYRRDTKFFVEAAPKRWREEVQDQVLDYHCRLDYSLWHFYPKLHEIRARYATAAARFVEGPNAEVRNDVSSQQPAE